MSCIDADNAMKAPASKVLKPSSSVMFNHCSRGGFFSGCESCSQSTNFVLAVILHTIAEVNLLQVRELNE